MVLLDADMTRTRLAFAHTASHIMSNLTFIGWSRNKLFQSVFQIHPEQAG